MNIHKQVTTTALLLMLFATIGAAVVGVTYDSTYEIIKYNEQQALLKKLHNILPEHSYDNDLLEDTIELPADYTLGTTEPTLAYRARKDGEDVAVVFPAVAPNGYNGSIYLLVGVYHDGTLAGVRVVKHRETPGLGDAIEERRNDWILGFAGKSLKTHTSKQWQVKRDGGDFDQFTGATITPRAVVKAVHSALVYFEANRERLFSCPDDDKEHSDTEEAETDDSEYDEADNDSAVAP